MQHYEESVFFSLKCYLSFNPYYEHTTELDKQYCPMKGCLPADYIQLEMCTLLYNTIFWVTIECVLTSVYCVSPQGLRQKM